jgi:Porin PorA
MRRVWGAILLGLGVFLVVAAAMTKFYVADQLQVVPKDQYVETNAPGTGTYFDPTTLTDKRADLVAHRVVKGDVPASNDTTGVWDVLLSIETADGTFVQASLDRVAFDRKSLESVHCCGEAVDSQPVRHEGVTYNFPFDTPKHDIQFWDVTSKKAYPAHYVGTEKVQGLTTYKFVQPIPTQQIGTIELPGSLVGETAPSVQSALSYSNNRTVWIEPKTGVIVKGSEQTRTMFQNSAGEDKVTALEATFTFDDATQRSQAKLAKDNIRKIDLGRWLLPLVALVLGLAFAAAGLLLLRAADRPEASAGDRGGAGVPPGGPPEYAEPDLSAPGPAVPEHAEADRGGGPLPRRPVDR